MLHHLLAMGDIQATTKNLTTILGKMGGLFLIVFLGYHTLRHLVAGKHGAMIGALLIGIIPAMFFFDPTGATSFLTSTVHAIVR